MRRNLPAYTIVAATLLILLYIFATYYLYQDFIVTRDQPPGSWERAQVIYNGIASIAFTAIGVLLGTQVQQVNLAAARSDTEKAKAGEAKFKGAVRDAVTTTAEIAAISDDLGGGKPGGRSTLAALHGRLVNVLAE